jgi:MFS family permease
MKTERKNERHVSGRFYNWLVNDGEKPVYLDIPKEAREHVPKNFWNIGLAQTLTKLSEELSSAKTILPWLLDSLGASGFWIGFLVPVRESMSMLPQLFISGIISDKPVRKNVWVFGAAMQAVFLMLISFCSLFLEGNIAGFTIVALLFLYSTSRGFSSLTSKDVIGKTIPKTRRGRLNGFTSGISGLAVIMLGMILLPLRSNSSEKYLFSIMLFSAALLIIIAALYFSRVNEVAGERNKKNNILKHAVNSLKLTKSDKSFRMFVIVRALFISTALSAPYYILAAKQVGGGIEYLGMFILVTGVASSVSSFFWGKFSDRSSRQVLIASASIAATAGIAVALFDFFFLISGNNLWILLAAYFIFTVAHRGIRIARKTYILDLAAGDKRTSYVAVANSIIGLILLLSGLLGSLSAILKPSEMIFVFSCIACVGIILSGYLPEVQK